MESIRYIENVATLILNSETCVGCGMCTTVCPHGVLAMDGPRARIVDLDGCMECGACAVNCPVDALSLTPGVGCASYIMQVWLKGKQKASCDGKECC